ncbi:serine/arginine repetitive matrix protein 1-like [Iris pallida]|uniref:Serine/arginine repetitive matrix protein 1-like n=1 Tax=Iris pallida TaxID=29817 RepID=A0AAX6GEN6_IRIPA|nr:serine/arginine repetitive matrix protein 1-like [Iris pallida]
MELKKKQRKKSSSNPQEQQGGGAADELSLVKAAAWAWFQHGSGCSHSKPVDDGLTRTRTRRRPGDPRPSRHRLETLSPPGSHLLDRYEIEQITKELNHLIVSTKERSNNRRQPAAERKASGLARIGLCRPGAADVIEASVVAGGGRRIRRGGERKEGANG